MQLFNKPGHVIYNLSNDICMFITLGLKIGHQRFKVLKYGLVQNIICILEVTVESGPAKP